MLSDFFYCGIVAGGAMLGVSLVARAMPRDREPTQDMRGLAILMAAFAEGLGVLAIVIGMLATVTLYDTGGPVAAAVVIASALVLGVPAAWMLRLNRLPTDLPSARGAVTILAAFVAGLALLTLLVGLLAFLLEDGAGASGFNGVMVIAGAIGAIAAAGVGYVGSRGVRALAGDDAQSADPVDAEAVRLQAIIPAAILEAVGLGTVVVAMMLVLVDV